MTHFRPAGAIDAAAARLGRLRPGSAARATGSPASSRSRRRSSRASAHDFHLHPGQEEVIYVLEGTIEQWVESESQTLTAGDAVVIPADAVHATFNETGEPAKILAILSPAVEGDGYAAVDVAAEEPWASLRP